jgi:hypothetical protein
MYRELNIRKITEAINLLRLRMNDRFPDSNLLKVAEEQEGFPKNQRKYL